MKKLSGGWPALCIGSVLALLCGACRDKNQNPSPGDLADADEQPADADRKLAEAEAIQTPPLEVERRSLLDLKDRCTMREHGLVIDLGSRAAAAYENFNLDSADPPEPVFFQGHSFRPLDQMSEDFVFWTQEDLPSVGFEALVHGQNSERMAAYIDGVRLGAVKLKPDEIRVVRISKANHEIPAGRHRLTLALSRPRGGSPSADVGWIRLGQVSKTDADQPTPRDRVFSEVTIAKDRQAGIVVKAGAMVSCPLWLPEKTRLTLNLGVWGSGLAEAEIVIVDESGEEHLVTRVVREEDKKRDFEPLELDLGPYASQLVDLQFRAQPHERSAQVVFGSPRLSHEQTQPKAPPRAKRAILIVLSALSARHSPPASSTGGFPVLSQLAQLGTAYPNFRASSTSATAVVTSLLTGLAPYQHGLEDLNVVLPQKIATLAAAVEAAGGRSAFMTGVPTSSSAFGLDRGFESFSVTLPQEDKAATAPLDEAIAWLKTTLEAEGPVLSIIHLRGAHPPFDISRERGRELPPREYGGDLTPRRAAIQLGSIARRPENRQQMNEEDWIRLFSMEKVALNLQSDALFDLIKWLRAEDLYDDTLLVMMGDVAAGERPTIPYQGDAPLQEQFLSVPLVIKYPKQHLSSSTVKGLFAPRDVTKTIAKSLMVDFSLEASGAIDLALESAPRLARTRPHLAYRRGKYSMRLGSKLLRGEDSYPPTLCFFDIDPACQTDRSDQHPDTVHALWLTAFSELHPALKARTELPKMEEKEEFLNSLIVWGLLR